MSETQQCAAAHRVRSLAQLDLPGGGQIVVRDGYAFVGHMSPPDGTSIIDVRDPRKPKVVARIAPPDPYSHTHKVRVVGNLMITNVERNRKNFYRKAEKLDAVRERLFTERGCEPTDAEIAQALDVAASDISDLRASLERGAYAEGGFRIFDISNPAEPRQIAYQRTGGIGVHRFDADDRYAYISTEMEGYQGNILVIYDLARPEAPREVSRWWMPGQHLAGGEKPTWSGQRHRLHHTLRCGDRLYASCWYGGAYIIDVSDIANPTTLGSFNYHPPFPEPTHTFMKIPQPVAGRDLALIIDEAHAQAPGRPHAFMWIVDTADPKAITPISTFHVSEMDSPYARAGGRFGAHQFQEHLDGTLVFVAWFSGGLRVVDIADPTAPREVGSYIPFPRGGETVPQSNDVDVDERGLVYLLDRNRGLDVLEFLG